MINVDLDGTPPNKISRINPEISVETSGKIVWTPAYTDYDVDAYYRGKTVTNQEFNELLLKDVYQGNYITDTLNEIFNTHLGTSIERYFKSIYNLIPSYVKIINIATWGEMQNDGYYYITVPASEHGFELTEDDENDGQINIDVEVYLVDSNGEFHEVMQFTVNEENTVTLYSDDNTLTGFAVIRTNDKSYALSETHIDASQVTGLASVATSGNYTDLINRPDAIINSNTTNIAGLLSGTIKAARAEEADSATDADNVSSTIQNIPITNIFETGSSVVKNATNAVNATNANFATNAVNAINYDDGTYGIIKYNTTKNLLNFNNTAIIRKICLLYASNTISIGTYLDINLFEEGLIPFEEYEVWAYVNDPYTPNSNNYYHKLNLVISAPASVLKDYTLAYALISNGIPSLAIIPIEVYSDRIRIKSGVIYSITTGSSYNASVNLVYISKTIGNPKIKGDL